uniref:U1-type domain-containing protein n=1 Tax=Latimeria chalumnae TaxID=7897 RepID=H3B864_LATCH
LSFKGMKKPWSPDPPLENSCISDLPSVIDEENETDLTCEPSGERKEKKYTNFTLCEVCNIQLNSAAQADIHYNGKSHQRRIKQLNNGRPASSNGTELKNVVLLLIQLRDY